MHRSSFARGALLLTLLGVAVFPVFGVATAADDEERGYLGVRLQDLSPSMAKALQLGDRAGVLVNDVVRDSPADRAGVEAGDVILTFAGAATPDADALTSAVSETAPGTQSELSVLRDGKTRTLEIELGSQPDSATWFSKDHFDRQDGQMGILGHEDRDLRIIMGDDDEGVFALGDHFDTDRGYLGVRLDALNEQLGEYFGVKNGQGALVTAVVKDSPAAAAGLKAGDVIVELKGETVDSPEALHEFMAETEPGQKIDVTVLRDGQRVKLQADLAEMPEPEVRKLELGDADWHAKMPLMLRRLHADRDGQRDIEIRRLGPDDEELQQLKMELQELKAQLEDLKEEIRK